MAAGTQSLPELTPEPESQRGPETTVCESAPGTVVLLESGNTDGWIASDVTVDVRR